MVSYYTLYMMGYISVYVNVSFVVTNASVGGEGEMTGYCTVNDTMGSESDLVFWLPNNMPPARQKHPLLSPHNIIN